MGATAQHELYGEVSITKHEITGAAQEIILCCFFFEESFRE